MRAFIAGCALLILSGAAVQAQPFYGDGGPPPPPPDGGFHHRPPPPDDFDGPPPPRWHHHRHKLCRVMHGPYGPHRVCRGGW